MAKKKHSKQAKNKGGALTPSRPRSSKDAQLSDPVGWLFAFGAGFAGFCWFAYFGQGLLFISNMNSPALNVGSLILAGILCGLLSRSYVHAMGAALVAIFLIFTTLDPTSSGAAPVIFLVFIGVLFLMLSALLGEFAKRALKIEQAWLVFGGISIMFAFFNMIRIVGPGQ